MGGESKLEYQKKKIVLNYKNNEKCFSKVSSKIQIKKFDFVLWIMHNQRWIKNKKLPLQNKGY